MVESVALRQVGREVGGGHRADGEDQPDPAKRSHVEAQYFSPHRRELRITAVQRRLEVAEARLVGTARVCQRRGRVPDEEGVVCQKSAKPKRH